MCGVGGVAAGAGGAGPVWSSGFEDGALGWQNVLVRSSEYDAPVDGVSYGVVAAGAAGGAFTTPIVMEAGRAYEVTAWARSVYSDAHLACLESCGSGELPEAVWEEAVASVALVAGGTTLGSRAAGVTPTALAGAPETETSDDGANAWVDAAAGFRHTFSERHFYQPIASDPILGPWFEGEMPLAFMQDDMLAKSAVIFPDGTRRLYGFNSDNPFCQGTGENCQAILFAEVTGTGDPLYEVPAQPRNRYVVWHAGDEDPWLGDPHVFVDEQTGRSWLTFGGGTGMYVAELDSATGYVLGFDGPIGFDANPEVFTRVADWSGDEWTLDSEWFEGGALYREGDWWYLFTSNGSLAENYTIRVGRGVAPTGPFFDKRGRDLAVFDAADAEYGNSFVLGDDAYQLLPGHAHLWREGAVTYMGFDYRLSKGEEEGDEPMDFMAIRRVYWENGWPTIWRPITLTVNADDYPALIGQPIGVVLGNVGEAGSLVAFDRVSVRDVEPVVRTRLGVLGDSITEGVFGTTYATFLADLLGASYDVLEWEGRKGHGVSGATLVQNSFLPIWDTGAFADLLASSPDVVTVMLGTNDASDAVPPALFANYESDLRLLVATLGALPSSPEVVLCTPPPAFAISQEADEKIRTVLIPIIGRVADDLGLRMIDVYHRVDDYPANWPDQLHPDAAGNANLAEIFFAGLTRPRTAAGWALPAGQGDFFDVVGFLRAFDAMDRRADVAKPFRVFDSADIRGVLEDASLTAGR